MRLTRSRLLAVSVAGCVELFTRGCREQNDNLV